MNTTDVQEFRLERLFQAYKDEDGYITFASYTAHVAELAKLRGQSPDEPHYRALMDSLRPYWDAVTSVADTDSDGRISRAEWYKWAQGMVTFLAEAAASDQPWPLDPWVENLIAVIDGDGDGLITVDEYRNWLDVLHLSDGMDVEGVFASFDTNNDGYLSREEFSALTRDYWTNFDPGIAAHAWLGGV